MAKIGNIGNTIVPLAGRTQVTTDTIIEYVPLLVDNAGRLKVDAVVSAASNSIPLDSELTIIGTTEGELTASVPYLFDGTDAQRQRNNTQETVLASAARTASINSADFTNHNAKGVHIIINVSAIAATPSIVVTIQGKDPVSGNYYDLLVGTAITATGINVIKVYPGIGQIANGAASDLLPRIWRVSIANADADSITYSVGANLVL